MANLCVFGLRGGTLEANRVVRHNELTKALTWSTIPLSHASGDGVARYGHLSGSHRSGLRPDTVVLPLA